jgi:hypothetical protein
VLTLFRRVVSSRLGQFLFVAHLVIIVYEFAQKPGASYGDTPCFLEPSSQAFIAGRPYHWTYESDLLKWVTILDLPALLLGELTSNLLLPLGLCAFSLSWVAAILILTFASIQWLLAGFIIESSIRALSSSYASQSP